MAAAPDIPGLSQLQREELTHLGAFQQILAPDPPSSRALWIGFLVFFLLFGLIVAAIPFLPAPRGVPPASPVMVGTILVVIGLMLTACVWRLSVLATERRVQILLFEGGLARFDGKELLTCRWDEIETVLGIVHKGPKPFASQVTVAMRDGKSIRTYWAKAHLAVGVALFQRLSEESCRLLLPHCLAAVEAGRTVTFQAVDAALLGAIAPWSRVVWGISKAGLQVGGQEIAWNDAENIDVKDGLRIRSPRQTALTVVRPWIRLTDVPLPNSLVFQKLAEHCLKAAGR